MPIYSDGHVVTAAEFNAMMPVGVCLPFAASSPPSGWLLCDGSAVSRTTYADLFSVIGTTHGAGDGSTTFNVPDLRAKVAAGYKAADPNFGTFGGNVGEAAHTLSAAEMPVHNHSAGTESAAHTHTFSGGSHNHTGTDRGAGYDAMYTSSAHAHDGGTIAIINIDGVSGASGGATANYATGSATVTGSNSTESANHSHSIGNAGSGSSHNNIQPSLALLYIIRY